MSIDMFPDRAVEYITRMAESDLGMNLWMEHAVAAHSQKAHDDFYDFIGEDLYHLHAIYYPNCDDALEYYIEEGAREGLEQAWFITDYNSVWSVNGADKDVALTAESYPSYIFFYGPTYSFEVFKDIQSPSRTTGMLFPPTQMAAKKPAEPVLKKVSSPNDAPPGVPVYWQEDGSFAYWEQPWTGVETADIGCKAPWGPPCGACRYCQGAGVETDNEGFRAAMEERGIRFGTRRDLSSGGVGTPK